jgi:CRP/FNR family transcriptional regulator
MAGAPASWGETTIRLAAGEALFRPGMDCPGFIALSRGVIRVSLTARNGREATLYRVRPGEVCLQTFRCLLEDAPYAAEGVAERAVQGVLTPAAAFRRRVAEDAAFRDSILMAAARRFADFERLVETVALSGLDARLAGALLRLADAGGVVALTHEALAAETASGRAAVSRRLEAFAARGLVEQGRGRLRLGDAEALARIAEGEA